MSPDPPTTEDLRGAILQNAVDGIAEVTVDGMTVRAKSSDDQIVALQNATAKTAAAKPSFGLRFSKLVPPGCG